uniref:Kinesin motor domain-containing protein n=2 Tax=Globisporangium ultimum (strain ATCC 200006 / CBS 805.95 / DAOM BR144) TaxID=431595 RepID=K3W5G0_GLOUD
GDASVDYELQEDDSVHVSGIDKRFVHLAGLLSADNSKAYADAIRPLVPVMLAGGTSCCFAYGHTNSGKTHTIFGYGDAAGMHQRAISDLFAQSAGQLLVQVRFYELYNGKVYDLLNKRQPGFVREDAHGVIHVRSATTMGPNGEVLTQSLHAAYADSPDALIDIIESGRSLRAEGTSELHHQSSRSHAVLELEIVTAKLAQARKEVVVAESRVVPLGKARDDLYIKIQTALYTRGADGSYAANSAVTSPEDTARLNELETQVRLAEADLEAAKARAAAAKTGCVGGMLVFVDLAGAEYTGQGLSRNPKEKKEAMEINTSLLALKECIRAAQIGAGHIPFRNSKLTMVLKCHLESSDHTVMIATVSSSVTHRNKAVDTIKYAALVADAFMQSK